MIDNRKKRFLLVGESSTRCNSGFSNMSMALLSRLHATNLFEIAELQCYSSPDEQQTFAAPWKIYTAQPSSKNIDETRAYHSDMHAQFGSIAFENVCLDFCPDIVFDFRDAWMTVDWLLNSPYRKYFKYIIAPMVDSKVQDVVWLEKYKQADILIPAVDFARKTLEEECPGIKLFPESLNCSVDEKLFRPLDKVALRKKHNISSDANVIIKIFRSNPRKDSPGAMEAFAKFLKKCVEKNNKELANKTFILMNCSWPDVGHNIIKHSMFSGVSHRILFTFTCQACRNFFIGPTQTELTYCPHCNQLACHHPNTSNGLTREQLVEAFNLADLCLHMSCSEGDGMPLSETRACGIPIMATDYAAMEDKVREPGGIPLKVIREYYEPDNMTGQKRVFTDTEDVANKLYEFFTSSKEHKAQMGRDARKTVELKYGYDRATGVLINAIESLSYPEHSETWFNQKLNLAPNRHDLPQFNSNGHVLDWGIDNILGKPELKTSLWRHDLLKSLNTGIYIGRGGREHINPQRVLQIMYEMAAKQNYWEHQRINKFFPQSKKTNWESV